jgi:hypothetical protein
MFKSDESMDTAMDFSMDLSLPSGQTSLQTDKCTAISFPKPYTRQGPRSRTEQPLSFSAPPGNGPRLLVIRHIHSAARHYILLPKLY